MKPPARRTCKKRGFRSELDAKLALARTQLSQATRREECRVYRHSCGKWHLTSMPKNAPKESPQTS